MIPVTTSVVVSRPRSRRGLYIHTVCTYIHTSKHTYMHTYILAYIRTELLTYLHTYIYYILGIGLYHNEHLLSVFNMLSRLRCLENNCFSLLFSSLLLELSFKLRFNP